MIQDSRLNPHFIVDQRQVISIAAYFQKFMKKWDKNHNRPFHLLKLLALSRQPFWSEV